MMISDLISADCSAPLWTKNPRLTSRKVYQEDDQLEQQPGLPSVGAHQTRPYKDRPDRRRRRMAVRGVDCGGVDMRACQPVLELLLRGSTLVSVSV